MDRGLEQKKEGGIINQQGKGGGAKSKLSTEQKATLKVELGTKDFWTLGEIDQLVQDKFGVNYSQRHLRTILKEMGVFHSKPEPLDYRRSDKSEQELTDKLLATTDALQLLGLNIDEIAFGFADEACPQANSNTARMWSIYRKTRKVNTQKLSCKTFGFYALNGNSFCCDIENAKPESFSKILYQVKEQNQKYKATVLLWDNVRGHINAQVQQTARKLGIFIINIPKYAPDLNPIEKVWKQVKRKISQKGLILSKDDLKSIIKHAFDCFANSTSAASKWIEDFFSPCWKYRNCTNSF